MALSPRGLCCLGYAPEGSKESKSEPHRFPLSPGTHPGRAGKQGCGDLLLLTSASTGGAGEAAGPPDLHKLFFFLISLQSNPGGRRTSLKLRASHIPFASLPAEPGAAQGFGITRPCWSAGGTSLVLGMLLASAASSRKRALQEGADSLRTPWEVSAGPEEPRSSSARPGAAAGPRRPRTSGHPRGRRSSEAGAAYLAAQRGSPRGTWPSQGPWASWPAGSGQHPPAQPLLRARGTVPGGSAEVTNRQRCRLSASSPFQHSVPLPAPSGKIYPASKRCEMRATEPAAHAKPARPHAGEHLRAFRGGQEQHPQVGGSLVSSCPAAGGPGVVFGDTFLPRWLEMDGECRKRGFLHGEASPAPSPCVGHPRVGDVDGCWCSWRGASPEPNAPNFTPGCPLASPNCCPKARMRSRN